MIEARRSLVTSAVAGTGRRAAYSVEIHSRWDDVAASWIGAPTPFQSTTWLGTWYKCFSDRADLTPLLVTAQDAESGDLALRLPLVLSHIGTFRTIGFADLHLTDYNAPVLGPASPTDRASAGHLWRAIRRRLPPADLVRLVKMPPMLRDRPNPLALLPGAVSSGLNGNVVHTGVDYDGWRHTLDRRVRKELERSWRVFSKVPGARFLKVTDPREAQAIVRVMEDQHQVRMAGLGLDYVLAQPEIVQFYRDLVVLGMADGTVVLTALTVGSEVVATLLGIRDADSYVMVRISHAGVAWSNCSPGRLVIERTMAALHAEGHRVFDFSVGDYDYKRRFGVTLAPLTDYVEGHGVRGLAAAMRAKAIVALRRHPALDSRLRGWRDRLSSPKR